MKTRVDRVMGGNVGTILSTNLDIIISVTSLLSSTKNMLILLDQGNTLYINEWLVNALMNRIMLGSGLNILHYAFDLDFSDKYIKVYKK